jgi:rhodanese-related sulfurtransferase
MIGSPSITSEALIDLLGTPRWPEIIDVRRANAYEIAEDVIATAVWQDHRRAVDWGQICRGGSPVVVYCARGDHLSQGAAAVLRADGIAAAYLDGGISAWRSAGGITINREALKRTAGTTPSRWITADDLDIGRLACVWFIRRFIDRTAVFQFVKSGLIAPIAQEIGAIPFGPNQPADRQEPGTGSLDAFVRHFQVTSPAINRLAAIVRGAATARFDLAPESAGLAAIADGVAATADDERDWLRRGIEVCDALYARLRTGTPAEPQTPSGPAAGGAQAAGR